MRPHFLGAARGRPALPVLRRLLATLLAAAVALLGLVALSTSTAPSAHAADPPVRNLLRPTIYNDPRRSVTWPSRTSGPGTRRRTPSP